MEYFLDFAVVLRIVIEGFLTGVHGAGESLRCGVDGVELQGQHPMQDDSVSIFDIEILYHIKMHKSI